MSGDFCPEALGSEGVITLHLISADNSRWGMEKFWKLPFARMLISVVLGIVETGKA